MKEIIKIMKIKKLKNQGLYSFKIFFIILIKNEGNYGKK